VKIKSDLFDTAMHVGAPQALKVMIYLLLTLALFVFKFAQPMNAI